MSFYGGHSCSLATFQLTQPTCDFVVSILLFKAFLQALLLDILSFVPHGLAIYGFHVGFLLTFCYYNMPGLQLFLLPHNSET